MRLIQLSDLHLFADPKKTLLNLNTYDSFKAVLTCLKQDPQKPNGIILTGDLSQDNSPESYQNVVDLLQDFTCPIYWLAGNHDAPDVMDRVLGKSKLKNNKQVVQDNWQFILLNSHYPGHVEGLLPESELITLHHYLDKYPDKNSLIFLHHQPIKINTAWLDKSCLMNADKFLDIIHKCNHKNKNIKAIVFGHIHQVYETHWENIALLSAPSTCIQSLPNNPVFALDTAHPGYRWFELNANGLFETGVIRVKEFNNTADFSAEGY